MVMITVAIFQTNSTAVSDYSFNVYALTRKNKHLHGE